MIWLRGTSCRVVADRAIQVDSTWCDARERKIGQNIRFAKTVKIHQTFSTELAGKPLDCASFVPSPDNCLAPESFAVKAKKTGRVSIRFCEKLI